jgi:hypothetical protein
MSIIQKLAEISPRSRTRWIILSAAVFLFMVLSLVVLNKDNWVETWLGAMFRAASGLALGWAVTRYLDILDLSAIDVEHRPIVAISRAIIMSGCAIATSIGV